MTDIASEHRSSAESFCRSAESFRRSADRLVALFWVASLLAGTAAGLVVGVLVGAPWRSLLLGLGAGAAVTAWGHWAGERRLAAALGVTPSTVRSEADEPRLASLVESAGLLTGVEMPRLCVVDSPAANAAWFGRNPYRSTLVVTRALLDGLSRIELEAVVASAAAQIRDGRTAHVTTALTTVGLGGLMVPGRGGPMTPLLRRCLRAADDIDADAVAVSLTRYPPGLIGALEAIDRIGADVGGPPLAEPLWLVAPASASASAAAPLPAHRAEVSARVAVLREL